MRNRWCFFIYPILIVIYPGAWILGSLWNWQGFEGNCLNFVGNFLGSGTFNFIE